MLVLFIFLLQLFKGKHWCNLSCMSWVCCGSSSWLDTLTWEASRQHPFQMAEPPQPAPFDIKWLKTKSENLVEQLTPQFTGNKSLFHWYSASGDAKSKSILSEHDSQALQCDCSKARKKSTGNHCPKGSGRLSTTSVTERCPFKKFKTKHI